MKKGKKVKSAQRANSSDGIAPRTQIIINGRQYTHAEFHLLGRTVMFNYLRECLLEGQYEHLKKVVDYMRLKLDIDNDPYMQFIVVVAAVKTGNKEEALNYCNDNIATWPRADWFRWKQWVLKSMGRYKEAEECNKEGLEFERKKVERKKALYNVGQAQLNLPIRAKRNIDNYAPQVFGVKFDDVAQLSLNPAA